MPSLCTSQGKGKDTTQTGNGVMFDVTSYPACGSVGPESGLSSLVCLFVVLANMPNCDNDCVS